MRTDSPATSRAREIADDVLFPAALSTDQAEVVPRAHLDVLADAGFYGLSATKGVGGLELDMAEGLSVIEILAGACLATTFVWMQHLGTAATVSRIEGPAHDTFAAALATGRVRSGIAFSHLRRPGEPLLRAEPVPGGFSLTGTAPLVTGWGLTDVIHVAARRGDAILWLLVDAGSAPSLTARPLRLAAVNASATVALCFTGHFVPDERLTLVESLADWLESDATRLRPNGSLALGLSARCRSLLGPSPLDDECELVRAELDRAGPDELPSARARASLHCLHAAAALIAARGGRSMTLEDHAQRLGREALFLLVQGQTPSVRAEQLAQLSVGDACA